MTGPVLGYYRDDRPLYPRKILLFAAASFIVQFVASLMLTASDSTDADELILAVIISVVATTVWQLLHVGLSVLVARRRTIRPITGDTRWSLPMLFCGLAHGAGIVAIWWIGASLGAHFNDDHFITAIVTTCFVWSAIVGWFLPRFGGMFR